MGDANPIFDVVVTTDPRITAQGNVYSAIQGASAISVVRTASTVQSSNTNLTFSVIPPSPQVVIPRAIILELTCNFKIICTQGANMYPGNPLMPLQYGIPLIRRGIDLAVATPYPLGMLVQSYNVQVNNCSVQQQNVSLPDLAHVLTTPKDRARKATTARVPYYASWDDAYGTTQALGSVADMQGEGDIGPGGYSYIFTDPNGTPLPISNVANTYTDPTSGVVVPYVWGVPQTSIANQGSTNVPVFVQVRFRDTVVCSPFGFNYADSWEEPGFYGISSMLFNLTMANPSDIRLWQCSSVNGFSITPGPLSVSFLPPGRGITNAAMWMTYMSPPITSNLPPRSIVPLCNLQFYQKTVNVDANTTLPGQAPIQALMNFDAVTFSCVPDCFIISIRPTPGSQGPTEAQWQATYGDGCFNQFVFANMSGVFSGFPSYFMTAMAQQNGSRGSLAQYGGPFGDGYMLSNGVPVQAAGGPMIIRPAQDFALPTGVAPGSTGQCQLNFQLKFNAFGCNPTGRQFVCTVTAVNTGFFVTDGGNTRTMLVGLNEATVLSAPEAGNTFSAKKLVGGNKFLRSLGAQNKNELMRAHTEAAKALAEAGLGQDRQDPQGWTGGNAGPGGVSSNYDPYSGRSQGQRRHRSTTESLAGRLAH